MKREAKYCSLLRQMPDSAMSRAAYSIGEIGKCSADMASTVPTVFMTVYHSLYNIAQLKEGEKILIHSATGGVGLAAIAYAKQVGAEIYATAGNKEKRAYLQSLGIDYIYDSRRT